MKLETYKKFQIPLVSIILLSMAFNFLAAPLALAADNPSAPIKAGDEKVLMQKAEGAFSLGSAFLWGLNTILTAVLLTVTKFVSLAGSFFDLTIRNAALSGFNNLVAIQEGWKISRDVANLFFILILLAIAIATILRIQSHNAKALLVKLITIALLINFSLTISYIVIDSANILGRQFWNVLTKNGSMPISQSLIAGARFQKIFDTSDIDQGSYVRSGALWGNIGGLLAGGIIAAGCATGIFCPGAIGLAAAILSGAAVGVSWAKLSNIGDVKSAIDYFYLVMSALIVSLPLIFVFVFGGILMIIRFAILAILLVLAPLAFLFYILPTTEKHWHTWWEKLIMHSFFFPAFMFLLYISVSIANAMARNAVGGNITQDFAFWVDIFTVVVLLISSLLIARTMGVYFAGSVLGWATASRKWLTGAVGAVAARYTTGVVGTAITPAAAKMQARFPILGTAPTAFAGWLRGLGGAEKRAEAMADFAKKLTPDRQARYYAGLNNQEKSSLLNKMTPAEQQEMMKFMSPADRASAETFLKRQVPPTAAAAYDAEGWKRMTLPQQQAQMAGYLTTGNLNATEQALRGMSDEERAALVDGFALTNPALAANAEALINSRFSPKDAQNFRIARIMQKPKSERVAAWSQPNFTDDDKEALLRKMKSDEDRAEFADSLGAPGALARDSAESVIRRRFTPKEQQDIKVAGVLRKSEDEQRKAHLDANDDGREALLRKLKDDDARARFIAGFRKAPSTAIAPSLTPAQQAAWNAGAADAAEGIIKTRFSAGEYRSYREAAVKNVSQKKADDLEVDVSLMSDEDLDILTKVGDENKVARVINILAASADADKHERAKKLGGNISKRNLQSKYGTFLTPRAYVENVEGVAYADYRANPAGYANYQRALVSHLTKVDAKAMRRNLSPEIIKQKEFVEDMLAGATIEDISLITGDARRAAAFKEGFEGIIGKKTTPQERADALATAMQARNNNMVAQELRNYVGSPYRDVIESILEGKPPPIPSKTP